MKLLIVDDSSEMRRTIRAVVADLADTVVECADGEGAPAVYAAERFSGADRVLMDLQMPGVGGLEATRRIRAAFPDAQVVIVTQHDDGHWRRAASQVGACGYVVKENLLDVRRLLQESPVRAPAGNRASLPTGD